MDSTYCTDSDKKKPHLGFVLVYMILEIITGTGLILMNEGEEINGESSVLFILLLVIYVFIFAQFVRLKNRLWDADSRYGIDSWNRKSIATVCMAVAISIACPAFFMYSYAVKDTPKTALEIHDTDDQNAADEVRKQMLDLGMDATVLSLLPDSEVMNYKDAVSMTADSDNSANADDHINCMVYDFYFCNENADYKYSVRSLYVTEINGCKYRTGIYYRNHDDFLNYEPTGEQDVFVSVLQKQGEKYYEKEPINCDFSGLHGFDDSTRGFDFRAEENQVVLFAMSCNLRNYRKNYNITQGLLFITQRLPFAVSYSTVCELADATGKYDFYIYSDVEDIFMNAYYCWDYSMFTPDLVGQTYYSADEYDQSVL